MLFIRKRVLFCIIIIKKINYICNNYSNILFIDKNKSINPNKHFLLFYNVYNISKYIKLKYL